MILKILLVILMYSQSMQGATEVPNTMLENAPRVTINSGIVEGKTVVTSVGKKVDMFLGIPYGEAPKGRQRFKPSKPIKPWVGVLETKEHSLACYQFLVPFKKVIPVIKRFFDVSGRTEDCLKLAVWRPHNPPEDAKKHVMVWIHGGGFAVGSTEAEFFQGGVIASEYDVIVVSMNYRIGSLGFLYLGTEDIPGNAGLFDQLLALKWVRDNIEAFGGDPQKVTLFGQSAGAASIGYHLMSPLSEGLFQRIILQSGTPLNDWAFLDNGKAIEESMKLVENLGCPTSNLTAIAECLYVAEPEDIVSSEPIRGYFDVLIYKPTVDYKFLLETPREAIENGRIRHVDVLIGQNKNEGSYFLTGLMPLVFQFRDYLSVQRYMLDEIISTVLPWANNLVKKIIMTEYNDWTNQEDGVKTVDIAEKIFADYMMTCPINKFANSYHKLGRNVFRYYLTHRLSQNPTPNWFGVVHGEDVPIVFGLPLLDNKSSEADVAVSKQVMKYWTNFAKYGDPNGENDASGLPVWPQHESTRNDQMDIHFNSTAVVTGRREKYCVLWDNLIPNLMSLKS